jgi:cytochrome c oxidase subunit II
VSPIRTTYQAEGRPRSPRRSRRWVSLAVVLAGLAIVTTGCKSNAFTRQGMLAPVTQQGKVTLAMWQGSWIAAWAVGIVVWGGILWAIAFHRKRGDALPRQVRYNLPIEILYTVLPFIMVGVLFYFTARDENYLTRNPAHPDVVVNVIGQQWSWEFQYPQYAVTNPAAPYRFVTTTGQMWNPHTTKQHLPLLEIPAHETVRFNLISVDVIHNFWIVPFEFKRQVIPGFKNHFTITATKTTKTPLIGRCAELCGVYHARMLFRVMIVTPAQFRIWISQQQAAQNHSGGAQ